MWNRYPLASYALPASLARCGEAAAAPAVLLMMLAAGQPPARAALVVGVLAGSSAVSAPLVGLLLDSTAHARRVLVPALALLTGGLVAMAQPAMSTAALVAVAAVAGLSGPALTGGWTAQLGSWVPRQALPRAHAVDVLTYNVAGVAGPGLAAVVSATMGGRAAVLCAAGIVAIALVWVALAPGWPSPAPRGAHRAAPITALRQGLALPLRHPDLARVAIATTVGHCGLAFVVVSTPLLAQRLTGDVAFGGVLLSAFAVGGVLGASVAATSWFSPSGATMVVIGTAATGVLFLGLIFASSPALALIVMGLAGAVDGPVLAATFGVRQSAAPAQLRAQVFTTAASLKMAAYAVGAVLAGPLVDRSITATISTGALLHLVASMTAVAAGSLLERREATSSSVAPPQSSERSFAGSS